VQRTVDGETDGVVEGQTKGRVSLFTTLAAVEKFCLQQVNDREKRYGYAQTTKFLLGLNDTNHSMQHGRWFGQ
jgi:hypothetical protein